jgi:hypothetical protein
MLKKLLKSRYLSLDNPDGRSIVTSIPVFVISMLVGVNLWLSLLFAALWFAAMVALEMQAEIIKIKHQKMDEELRLMINRERW